jgi:hypothetical protein
MRPPKRHARDPAPGEHAVAVPAHLPHGGGGAGAVRPGLGLDGAAPPGPGARARWRRGARAARSLGRPAAALAAAARRASAPSRMRRCGTGRSGCACRWRWTMPGRHRVATSESPSCPPRGRALPARRMLRRMQPVRLDDGRTLWVRRPGMPSAARCWATTGLMPARRWAAAALAGAAPPAGPTAWGLAALLVVLFLPWPLGAWPVVRRLTRRLEALKQGVEAFGAGALHQRVAEDGRDEVAAVAAASTRPPRASRPWCVSTRACWPMPAMNCARRWRG